MARAARFSTSTVTDDGHLVPWLAASGPLSYTPESPPSSDYYFQYSWVMQGIFSDSVNKRQHFYFGASVRSHAQEVFSFWQAANDKLVTRVASVLGSSAGNVVTAPVAAYACKLQGTDLRVLIQHGSYQLLEADHQPLLESGEVILYRGIANEKIFRFFRIGACDPNTKQCETLQAYAQTQTQALSDSTRSFNSIHDRAKRTETCHIRDGTWLTDDIAKDNGLDLVSDAFAKQLWLTTHQSFTLAENIARWKFGPHFVKCKTPIDNIRLTSFFAGEHEVRIIDPDRVQFLECVGCELREISATE